MKKILFHSFFFASIVACVVVYWGNCCYKMLCVCLYKFFCLYQILFHFFHSLSLSSLLSLSRLSCVLETSVESPRPLSSFPRQCFSVFFFYRRVLVASVTNSLRKCSTFHERILLRFACVRVENVLVLARSDAEINPRLTLAHTHRDTLVCGHTKTIFHQFSTTTTSIHARTHTHTVGTLFHRHPKSNNNNQ